MKDKDFKEAKEHIHLILDVATEHPNEAAVCILLEALTKSVLLLAEVSQTKPTNAI